MKQILYKLIAPLGALLLSSFTIKGVDNNLSNNNQSDIRVFVKAISQKLELSDRQELRVEKLFEAYSRRVELSKVAYAGDRMLLNTRLTALTDFRDKILKRELGEEKHILLQLFLSEWAKKNTKQP